MTNLITLTIPNDDHVALRAFGKALEEMARERQPHQITTGVKTLSEEASRDLVEKIKKGIDDDLPELDTTTQQVESLAPRDGRNIEVTRQMVELCVPVVSDAEPPTTDSAGTQWDERIHSASKALNSDGTWRLRRKPKDMDEAEWAVTIQNVQDELLGQKPESDNPMETPEPTREEVDELIQASDEMLAEIRATIEPPVTPPGDDFHTDAGAATEQTVVGIPPIPVPPPVVVPPAYVANDWDFPKLMKFLTERHGKIDVPTVNQLLAVDGLAALTALNAHPDKIGPFVARVKAHLGE